MTMVLILRCRDLNLLDQTKLNRSIGLEQEPRSSINATESMKSKSYFSPMRWSQVSTIDSIRKVNSVEFIHVLEIFVRSVIFPSQVETAQRTAKGFYPITLHASTQNHGFAVKLAIDIARLGA